MVNRKSQKPPDPRSSLLAEVAHDKARQSRRILEDSIAQTTITRTILQCDNGGEKNSGSASKLKTADP